MKILKNNWKDEGYSLIEVMMALVVISFGLLTALAYHLQALKREQKTYFQSLALSQLQLMSENLRAGNSFDDSLFQLPSARFYLQNNKSGEQLNLVWKQQVSDINLALLIKPKLDISFTLRNAN